MTNENDFTGNSVLFADIMGFSKLTIEQKEEAEIKLKKFREIYTKIIDGIEEEKISPHPFSDSIVVGFKEIKDAISFSKQLFLETFKEKIHLRGTIGIGEFSYKKDSNNKYSLELGPGLVRASVAEKHKIKGHTLLLVCEIKQSHNFRGFGGFSIFSIPKLPKELEVFIIRWWENSKDIEKKITERMNGLTIKDIEYLEATKENIDYEYSNEHGDIDAW
ncbi:Uncharacterised protein [uncultured archaeon]|nr:Uncharacterised protein [uncultured archaeon]